jgi:hypothetical protein
VEMRAVQTARIGGAAAVWISGRGAEGSAAGGVGSGAGGIGGVPDVGGDAGERGDGGEILCVEERRGERDDGSGGGGVCDFGKRVEDGDD